MKQLSEQQILDNWNKLIQLIEDTFSGERKETQTNFCPAIALSSSKTSTYLGFTVPSVFRRVVTPLGA